MKLLVLDGNSIFNRAFYGIKLLTAKDGTFTNAIYGFLTMLHKIKEDTNPDAVAVAFDMRAPTFRHKEYDGYKAQRKGMPPELAQKVTNVCWPQETETACSWSIRQLQCVWRLQSLGSRL